MANATEPRWHLHAYMASEALLLVESLVALGGNALLLRVVPATALLDRNVRWLLMNVGVASVLVCAHLALSSTLHLWKGARVLDAAMAASVCAAAVYPYSMALMVFVYSFICVAVERLWATRHVTADDSGTLGVTMAVALWLLAFVLGSAMLVAARTVEPVYFCYPQFVAVPLLVHAIAWSVVAADLLALAIFLFLQHYIRTQLSVLAVNQAHSTLRARYQMKRTVELTRMLLPSVLLNCLIYSISLPATILIMKRRYERQFAAALIINAQVIFSLLMLVAHPLLCLRASSALRATVAAQLGVCSRHHSRSNTEEALDTEAAQADVTDNHHMTFEQHHDILMLAWSGSLNARRQPASRANSIRRPAEPAQLVQVHADPTQPL